MTQNLQNAIEKSRRIKMSVQYLGARRYMVVTPQAHKYVVSFETREGPALRAVQLQGRSTGAGLLPPAESGVSGYGHPTDVRPLNRKG